MERQKILSQFAIGLILMLAILIGGIFLMMEKREEMIGRRAVAVKDYAGTNVQINVVSSKNLEELPLQGAENSDACQARYYEGESRIKAWMVERDEESRVKVRVSNQDLAKLPTNKADLNADFVATLIDPTEEVLQKLENSSEENPTEITVRGFSYGCGNMHELSIKQATVAFKKS